MKVLWCLQWFATAVQQSWEAVQLWGFFYLMIGRPFGSETPRRLRVELLPFFHFIKATCKNKDGAYVPSGCGLCLFWCIKLLSWPLLSAAGKWSTGFQAVMWSSRVAHTVIKHITSAKLIIPSLSPCTINGPGFLTSLKCGVHIVVVSSHLTFLAYFWNKFGLVFYIQMPSALRLCRGGVVDGIFRNTVWLAPVLVKYESWRRSERMRSPWRTESLSFH